MRAGHRFLGAGSSPLFPKLGGEAGGCGIDSDEGLAVEASLPMVCRRWSRVEEWVG